MPKVIQILLNLAVIEFAIAKLLLQEMLVNANILLWMQILSPFS